MAGLDMLFEIGCEELPAGYIEPAMAQLAKNAEKLLTERRLAFDEIRTAGTPRRLAVYIKELEEKQLDLKKEIKGPPKAVAFEEGEPTGAARGFARAQGIDVDQLEVRGTERGEYVFCVLTEEGSPTEKLLPEFLGELMDSLDFSKTMRWGSRDYRFPRPVRWLVALYGREEISFSVAGVRAGRTTRGHRFLGEEIELARPGEYFSRLRGEFVLADLDARRAAIEEQVTELASEKGGKPLTGEGLLDEVTNLVEYPTALLGRFSSDYLSLPREVLITVMRKHQRYFPVIDKDDGRLLPYFIAVRNGDEKHLDLVQAGNEKVLRARLADARFFYDEDIKVPLSERLEDLKEVVFQEQLGTIYDKVRRMHKILEYLADQLHIEEDERKDLLRAGLLSKADLVTNMVNEFPELQGIMGGEYAAASGENETVSGAIAEHYLPTHSADLLPETRPGLLLSIADKLDTIIGCFGTGIRPTGSQDPYALRRQGYGVVRMILENDLDLSLQGLISYVMDLYWADDMFSDDQDEVQSELSDFFRQRLMTYFERDDLDKEIIRAVLAAGWDELIDVGERINALSRFVDGEHFPPLLLAFKRAANLASELDDEEAEEKGIDPSLFDHEVERDLYKEYLDANTMVIEALEGHDYSGLLDELADLREPVDRFFEEVMVMVEDPEVRKNRLLLLKKITELFGSVADFSQIHAEIGEENTSSV